VASADPHRFVLPPDFAERCAEKNRRVASGEALTIQNLADALGLPFEFVSAAIAISMVLQSGQPVIVDPAPQPKAN
jgi:hypothetical protein